MVCMDLLVAGYLSTSYLIGTGLAELLGAPAVLAAVEADERLMEAAVQEILRLQAPAQIVDRVVLRDCEFGGFELVAGATVSAVLGSANRDPDIHPEPDSFRLDRSGRAHLSYGTGIHECVGDALANAVTPIALAALLRASARIEGLAQWQTDPYLRGMVSLPISLS
jgi:cytochrome P450